MALRVYINRSHGVLEYWSVGLEKRALNVQIFSRDLFSESDEKRGFFHDSTTPILQYSAHRSMPVNEIPSGDHQSRALPPGQSPLWGGAWTRIFI
jgi:hypothetical protein